MPTYEYICKACGHTFHEFQSISESPLVRCPQCGEDSLARAMGTGGGLIFKGSGFYLTDYKRGAPPPTSSKDETPKGPNSKEAPKSASSPGTEKGEGKS